MPASVAKFTQPGCCIQMVRKAIGAPEIGARIFCGSCANCSIFCFIKVNICGTHPAEKNCADIVIPSNSRKES
jgi:hypothetical protein